MNTVNKLMKSSKEIWEKYNSHPFVKGIENGTLDYKKFRFYILQDFLYLQDYIKVFALGIVKSKKLETSKLFSKYINLILNSEMDIHKGYMKQFDFNELEVKETKPSIENSAYTSYMLRVAYDGNEVDILVAILACAYSYELIAKQIIKNNPNSIDHKLYGQWIMGYASDEYANGNVEIITIINEMTKEYSEEQIDRLIDIFNNCSKYEFNFWEMSWNS
ncbi:MAG: thiaminase II [Mycoplasma sp.]